MSADHDTSSDYRSRSDFPSEFTQITKASTPGMELSESRNQSPQQLKERSTESSNMSTLAIGRQPPLPSPSMMWEDRRQLDLPSRTRSPPERIELPSIGQAIPEIYLRANRTELEYRPESAITYSPPACLGATLTTTEHSQSPSSHKRRRLSDDDQELDSRDHVLQKTFHSPSRTSQRSQSVTLSPNSSARRLHGIGSSDNWITPNGTNNYTASRGLPLFEPSTLARPDWRPTLPSLPALTLNHSSISRGGRNHFSEYALDSSRSGAQTFPQAHISQFDPPISSYHPAVSYGYQQPRGQSFSGSSTYSLSHDRSPFSNSHHSVYPGNSFAYGLDRDDRDDSKQRKRRGNLPKETTDKLRTWFVAHLQHPYPTEDEKQDLMRQTGLQMNQISNWFINARRRQLPAMINNARAESDARSLRSGETPLQESNSEYGDEKSRSLPLGDSDGEGSLDGDYTEMRTRGPLPVGKRESI